MLVHTGRDAFYGQPDYIARGPGVTADGTRWLYERGVRVMGIDAWGWDAPLHLQAERAKAEQRPGVFWEAHQCGLAYSQIERLVNLGAAAATAGSPSPASRFAWSAAAPRRPGWWRRCPRTGRAPTSRRPARSAPPRPPTSPRDPPLRSGAAPTARPSARGRSRSPGRREPLELPGRVGHLQREEHAVCRRRAPGDGGVDGCRLCMNAIAGTPPPAESTAIQSASKMTSRPNQRAWKSRHSRSLSVTTIG